MTRDASYIGLIRLMALAVIFVVAGSLAGAQAMDTVDHHAPVDGAHDMGHADDMHVPESDCAGDECTQCDTSGGGDHSSEHYAEHCPDCLAQVPAGPETLRVDRRTIAKHTVVSDAGATGDITRPLPVSFLTAAHSGLTTRSPILRL